MRLDLGLKGRAVWMRMTTSLMFLIMVSLDPKGRTVDCSAH